MSFRLLSTSEGLEEKVMPILPDKDRSIVILEIRWLYVDSKPIPRRLEPEYDVPHRKGVSKSMEGFHLWSQDYILNKTYTTPRKEYCPDGSTHTNPQD
jgi:hypothetical protein